ncbi:MAG: hypothetical protein KDB86_13840 [Actinobacteria bacterium]|nr:hypothetical protein [Actinomycetota bacterium]MCB9390293.1 hypothetical protein [Acidimicrobiia bacterium]
MDPTRPAPLIAGGVVAATTLATGVPIAVCIIAALVANLAVAFLVRPSTEVEKKRVNPATLRQPWRNIVDQALDASRRYDETVQATAPGPLRDSLKSLTARVDDSVEEIFEVSKRGERLESALARMPDAHTLGQRLDNASQHLATSTQPGQEPTSSAVARVEAVESQISARQRMEDLLGRTVDELGLRKARLDETVVRTIELSAGSPSDAEVRALGEQVDGIVADLEALRSAYEDLELTQGEQA